MRFSSSRREASSGLAILSPALLLLLASRAAAQTTTNLPGLDSVTGTTAQSTAKSTETSAASATGKTTAATTTTGRSTGTTGTTTGTSMATTTGTTTGTTTTGTGTTASFAIVSVSLSNAPTIAGAGIPTQVIPYTAGAPFMQKSDLPEGTVFICVGAILGFLGACVLAWRGLVAWSLHRSVKRAAQSSLKNEKALLHKAPPPYTNGPGSNVSLDRIARPFSMVRPTSQVDMGGKSHRGSHAPSNLFFSPTAGAGVHSSPYSPGNRSSNYLPAGYYASTSANIPGSTSTENVRNFGHPTQTGAPSLLTSLTGGPQSSGYTRAASPPASPRLSPSHSRDLGYPRTANSSVMGGVGSAVGYTDGSSSTLNLGVPGGNVAGGRAPSAYLEDLFENHGNGPRERF